MVRAGGVRAKGNRIEVNIQHRGQRHVFTVDRGPTKANIAALERQRSDAKARLRSGESISALIAEMKGERTTLAPQSLGYWAQHYFDVVCGDVDDVADSTLSGYESLYNSHWSKFDNRLIAALTEIELQEHLSKRRVIKKTKREALALLKRIFQAAKLGTIENWVIKKSKRDKKPEPDPYTSAERDELLRALLAKGRRRTDDMIAYRYFLMGFYTGMRTGELLGAHWSDYEKPKLRVWQSMVRRKMQRHIKTEERIVLLPDIVIDMLDDTLNPTRNCNEQIFLTPTGLMFKDADWLMERWRRAHKKSGVRRRLGLYPWRHTFISLNLVRGVPIAAIAEQVGNSPSIIEKHYSKWIATADDDERLRLQLQEAQR